MRAQESGPGTGTGKKVLLRSLLCTLQKHWSWQFFVVLLDDGTPEDVVPVGDAEAALVQPPCLNTKG
jgi:hypothetical protein